MMQSDGTAVTIRFGDCDPAGVIFYPRAIELAHAAVEELITRSAIGWKAWFASPLHSAPIRHAEAEFLLPVRAGDTVTLRPGVERVGEASVSFAVDFLDAKGDIAIRVRTAHVLVDKSTNRPAPLTAEMRRAFEGHGGAE